MFIERYDKRYEAWVSVDTSGLSAVDLRTWLDNEPEPKPRPFKLFPLSSDDGREAFLEEFVFWGEERIFEAVSHLWDSLCEPKHLRAIGIGIAAGTGGTGKLALTRFLGRALRDALDCGLSQPTGELCRSLEEHHVATMSYFDNWQEGFKAQLKLYADLLVADPGGRASRLPSQEPHRLSCQIAGSLNSASRRMATSKHPSSPMDITTEIEVEKRDPAHPSMIPSYGE